LFYGSGDEWNSRADSANNRGGRFGIVKLLGNVFSQGTNRGHQPAFAISIEPEDFVSFRRFHFVPGMDQTALQLELERSKAARLGAWAVLGELRAKLNGGGEQRTSGARP
jgi:hypothetical protein